MTTALPPSSDFTGAATQSAAQTAYANQRTFLAGLLGTAGDVATAQVALGTLACAFAAKSANYTVVVADRGKLINCTGTMTLSLPTVATAGVGFAFLVRNGGGTVTVAPNGAETINGLATEVFLTQSAAMIVCNGSQWISLEMPGPAIQSATDSTIGAILRLATNGGAFGLGNTGNLPVLANFDATATATGIYSFGISATTTGTRPADWGAAVTGTIMVFYDGGNLSQLAWRAGPASGAAGIYKRAYISGAWTTWDVTFQRSNILGTVAQTGGVPTGAVIERGSNANGEYVKFADGTLM
jgi:hypothetical protein